MPARCLEGEEEPAKPTTPEAARTRKSKRKPGSARKGRIVQSRGEPRQNPAGDKQSWGDHLPNDEGKQPESEKPQGWAGMQKKVQQQATPGGQTQRAEQ